MFSTWRLVSVHLRCHKVGNTRPPVSRFTWAGHWSAVPLLVTYHICRYDLFRTDTRPVQPLSPLSFFFAWFLWFLLNLPRFYHLGRVRFWRVSLVLMYALTPCRVFVWNVRISWFRCNDWRFCCRGSSGYCDIRQMSILIKECVTNNYFHFVC